MCAIFGFLDYGKKVSASTLKRLLRALSVAAESRGTDATGISYVNNGNIVTFKKAKPAHKVKLYFPKDTTAVIGHTRFTTQGSEKNNYNNHPFEGSTDTHTFALAHNGVLYNDKELRKEMNLPDTVIETDSYIAVQLIEHENIVDSNSIKTMAEAVTGSFVFTILRDDNTLFIVKGDNPITLIHFPEYGLYVYASTTAILNAAMKAVKFSGVCNEVKVNDGDIIRIDSDGKLSVSTFEEKAEHFDWRYLYRLYGYDFEDKDEDYTNDLLMICGCYGVDREDVELLLELGYTTDEIEEMLLDSDLFEQTMNEVKTLYQR
ncbi:MAG: class II glutamine amidotransferase [Ruminococcus sp.]|nr:class II glutamine amidotransferase [Ruminococcus sp.]